jgi:hypothetical protein
MSVCIYVCTYDTYIYIYHTYIYADNYDDDGSSSEDDEDDEISWSDVVPWKLILGDALATVIERAVMYPLETVRTRMETDESHEVFTSQFTCFTTAKVRILMPEELRGRCTSSLADVC